MRTQQEVRTLSAMARTADLQSKMTSEKVEREVGALQQQLEQQKMLASQEAQASRSTQDVIARKLQEAQQMIQSTATTTQTYETEVAKLKQQMAALE